MEDKLKQRIDKTVTGGVVGPDAAQAMAGESGLPVGELMLGLIASAKGFAHAAVSGFRVGAVGLGESGALYCGANFEFPGCALDQTVHAEQAVVINAALHGETRLAMLAVSAAPCGQCRQLLSELAGAERLQLLLPGRASALLSEYLPNAFGPSDLGVVSRLLMPQHARLEWAVAPGPETASAQAALDAAAASFAPYSNSPAGVGLTLEDGTTFAGSYLESAAFNPSVAPLQAAIVAMTLAGHAIEDIAAASLVQLDDSVIEHGAAARTVLQQCAPRLALQVFVAHRY